MEKSWEPLIFTQKQESQIDKFLFLRCLCKNKISSTFFSLKQRQKVSVSNSQQMFQKVILMGNQNYYKSQQRVIMSVYN